MGGIGSFSTRLGAIVRSPNISSSWFTTQMAAAVSAIVDRIPLVDFTVEVRDARVTSFLWIAVWVFEEILLWDEFFRIQDFVFCCRCLCHLGSIRFDGRVVNVDGSLFSTNLILRIVLKLRWLKNTNLVFFFFPSSSSFLFKTIRGFIFAEMGWTLWAKQLFLLCY